MTQTALKTLRLIFLCVGVFILAGTVQKIGWASIQTQLLRLGWAFLPILSVGFFWTIAYTLAWKQIIKYQENNIPFAALFRAKIAGEAINTIQPANFLGGDPMRVYLLRKASNITCLAASVAVDRTVNSIAIVGVIFVGALIAFVTLHGLPPQVVFGAPIFLIVSSGLILFFLFHQHRGLFSSILRLAQKLRLFRHLAEKHLPHAQEVDEKVLKLYQQSPAAFWEGLFFHIVGRVLGIVEVYLIGKAITPEFSFLIALFLATLSPIINMAFTFIPGALGVMEGAYSAALYLLGLNPAIGFTIQIVKRIRSLLWVGLGLLFISFSKSAPASGYNKDPLQQPL